MPATLSNNKMQRTKHGSAGASPLILVLSGPMAGHRVRRSAFDWPGLVLAVCLLLPSLSCASRHAPGIQPTDRVTLVPDVTDVEWAAARAFNKSAMTAPLLVSGTHEMEAVGVPPGKTGYVKIATVIRKDGSLGVYRILTTNYAAFAEAVTAVLRKNRYQSPTLKGEPIALRVEWEYRAARE
jgi:hypothetical protein